MNLLGALFDPQFRGDVGRGLLDAGNRGAVAGLLGGPVDLASMAMRPFGYGVENPVGGSEWIGQKMQNAGMVSPNRNMLAEILASVAVPGAAVKAGPALFTAEKNAIRNLMAPAPGNQATRNQLGGVPLPKPTQAEKMAAVGYEDGWFRGGPAIENGKMSGPWYTRQQDEAADYAKRFGSAAEVREYAIPKTGMLDANRSYSSQLASDLAARASNPKLAAQLRSYSATDRPSGIELWQGLKNYVGEDGAMDALRSLGFKGVKGVNSPDYVRIFPGTVTRDAKMAAFDPAKINGRIDDIYGAATPETLAAVAGSGALSLWGLRRNQGGE